MRDARREIALLGASRFLLPHAPQALGGEGGRRPDEGAKLTNQNRKRGYRFIPLTPTGQSCSARTSRFVARTIRSEL
jgi:hypothetical protein